MTLSTELFLFALVGLAVAGARAFQLGKLSIDPTALGDVMEKCLRDRRLERARKICTVIAETPLGAGVSAMIAPRPLPAGATFDQARDLLADAFIAAFDERAAAIARYRFAAWIALALLVGPMVHALASDAPSARLVSVSLVGLVVLAWTARSSWQTLTAGPALLDRLLPHAAPLFLSDASKGSSDAPAPAIDDVPVKEPAPAPAGGLSILVQRDAHPSATLTLDESIIKIGRDARAHVQLDDPSIGRMHAVIERDSEGVVTLIDLGNRIGTQVRGASITKVTLAHGDVVEIGPFRLIVGIGAAPPA